MEALVFEALRGMSGWVTATAIAEKIGKEPAHIGRALGKLVWKDLVVKDGRHKRYMLASQKERLIRQELNRVRPQGQ